MEVYTYTMVQIDDYWKNHGGREYFIEHHATFALLLDEDTVSITKDNLRPFLHMFIATISSFITTEQLCNIMFWMNMYLYCEYGIELYTSVKDNMQWIFNSPDHEFEKYLVKTLEVDPYKTYATEFAV